MAKTLGRIGGWLLGAALASLVSTEARAEQIYVRSVGPNTCSEWRPHTPVGRDDVGVPLTTENLANALMLNWVLAFLSGYASAPDQPNLLDGVEPAAVANWLDYDCAANPQDTMSKAAVKLREELLRRPGLQPGP
jgi:hypothetical protein